MLTDDQVTRFIENGFVKVEQAFPEETAAECRTILWRETGCAPDDPATWTEPAIRINGHTEEPFRDAANNPRLTAAFDRLVGPGHWAPRGGLGTFPIRFPSAAPPGDDGWHLDASFQGDADPGDYFRYRVNVASKGRALLMLFLFSEIDENDAPTRIRVGSHLDVAPLLAPYCEDGLTMMEISTRAIPATEHRPITLATGRPGDVYLCHPFLVHSAQAHHGTRPRFLAQPPLDPVKPTTWTKGHRRSSRRSAEASAGSHGYGAVRVMTVTVGT